MMELDNSKHDDQGQKRRRIDQNSVRESLDNEEILRYSRQMILPEVGLAGQLKLKNTSVLIIGAGGLGCPASTYLAAAGIGRLGIVDDDVVELSNLHRQVLHAVSRIGKKKAHSATTALTDLNGKIECIPYECRLDNARAMELVAKYDIIVDCTDNLPTRYMLSDTCVLLNKPLVSGSALRTEGQLTTYNVGDGPCMRCIYPRPPSAANVTNCSDGGVLGMVPGVIGCLQALEVIKLVIGPTLGKTCANRLLLFDAKAFTFHQIKLRGKRSDCEVCSTSPTITSLIDYHEFCGVKSCGVPNTIVKPEHRISCTELDGLISNMSCLVVDVRPAVEFGICKLDDAINVPLAELKKKDLMWFHDTIDKQGLDMPTTIVVVCRRGNDSQIGVQALQALQALEPTQAKAKANTASLETTSSQGADNEPSKPPPLHPAETTHGNVRIVDLQGGLSAWSKHTGGSFPTY
eukprot:m.23658 g.23658  ORF g.23658 m.23658 type:complete len:462 (+) comp14299_c0_seq2:273-1658(+)